ncbi:MAG: DNA sulfur modification protein DndE [Pseudomonadales bacterium]
MLPNKMKISEKSFISLRRLQTNTGLTVNIGARLAFFASIGNGYHYNNEEVEVKHRELDKHTWLGEQAEVIEMLLKKQYPDLNKKEMYQAWASHIDHGSSIIETKTKLIHLVGMI